MGKIKVDDEPKKSSIAQIIMVVSIGTFMGALDSSIVNISLPNISSYFNISLITVEWIVLSYLIVISSLLLMFGRLGDLYGHKNVYVIGFAIFTVGSLLCALSPNIILLIIFRAFQAIGAGMLMSMGPAIITINTHPKNRGKSLGVIAISVSVALSIGPVLGGLLTTYFGWRSIFYINIPIGIAAFIWALKALPAKEIKITKTFDYAGAILLFLSLSAIIFPVSMIDKWGFKNPLLLSCFFAGIVLMVLFIIVENKIKHPMLDFSLFKNRLFSMGNLSLLLNFMAQFTVTLIVPFYLIQLRNMPASEAGLILIANPLAVMIVTPLSGYLSDRFDTRYISSAGMILISTGLFMLSTLNESSGIILIILYAAIIGLGIGMFQTPNNSAIMGAVPVDRRGTASSMLATMRNIGMVFGVALSGTLFTYRQNYLNKVLTLKGISGIDLNNQVFTGAMKFTFIIGGLLAIVAVITSLVRGSLFVDNK